MSCVLLVVPKIRWQTKDKKPYPPAWSWPVMNANQSLSLLSLSVFLGVVVSTKEVTQNFLRKKEKEVNMLSILLPALASGSCH